MLNPGYFTLCNRAITTALSGETQTAVDGLEGIQAATIKAQFAWGSGGTSAKAYVQVSLDGGSTFMDVAAFAFATSSATRVINLSGLTPQTSQLTPTDGSLADNTAVDGAIGSIWRVKLVTVGVYANTNLMITVEAR